MSTSPEATIMSVIKEKKTWDSHFNIPNILIVIIMTGQKACSTVNQHSS